MRIMQGDQYEVAFKITNNDGGTLTDSDVEQVEFSIGDIIKTFPGVGRYEDGKFYVPLTQDETFGMSNKVNVQIRVDFGETVRGVDLGYVRITPSISKVVL